MHPPDAPRDHGGRSMEWPVAPFAAGIEIAGGSIEDQLRKSHLIHITVFYHADRPFVNIELRLNEPLGRGFLACAKIMKV